MPALLSVENVYKSFDAFKVLQGVSFSLEQGEIFGLLGPNGAGKSTLMKIMIGVLDQDTGRVQLNGKETRYNKGLVAKTIGVVPQEENFYRSFTVKENLEYFGLLYGLSGKKLLERIDYLVSWLNLVRFKDKRAEHLSGGYRRLLNVACSLIHGPELVFMDEPTVGLDPDIRQVFWEKISELRREGKTIVLTTHYMDEAQELCDRIGIMWKGKLLVEGSPEKLIEEYGGENTLVLRLSKKVVPELIDGLKLLLPDAVIAGDEAILMISFSQQGALKHLAEVQKHIESLEFSISKLELKEPDLEDVFLNLVGEKSGMRNVEDK